MTLIIPPGFTQFIVSWRMTDSLKTPSNTIAFSTASDEPSTVIGNLSPLWDLHMAGGSVSSEYVIDHYETRSAALTAEALCLSQPSASFSACPPNASALVRLSGNVRGRANRGRFYLPAGYLDESQVDNVGNMSDALVGDLQTSVDAFFSDAFSGFAYMPVTLHTDIATAPTPQGTVVVDQLVATQRRRLR